MFNWLVGVKFVATSNLKGVFTETARSATQSSKAIGGFNSQLAGIASIAKVVDKSLMGVGLASAGMFAAGIKGAADLQQALSQIAVQTGRTIKDIDNSFTDVAMRASNRTGMSMKDALSSVRTISGVIKDPRELNAAIAPGGMVDFVNVLRKSGATEASSESITRNVITADHILNAYTGAAMAQVNSSLYRAVVGSHMELGPLVTQLGYFGEQFRLASGNRPAATDDILKLAELGYWGVGHGKWGAGFGQILRSIGHPTKMSYPAMLEMGMIDKDGLPSATTMNSKGEFTPMAMINEAIKATAGLTPMARQSLVNQLPANAARIMSEAMSPKTQAFLSRIDAQQMKMPSLMTAEVMLMGNLNSQTARLTTSFSNLATMIARPFEGPLAKFVGHLADVIGKWSQYFEVHPNESKLVGGGMLAAAAYAGVRLAQKGGNVLHAFAILGKHPHVGTSFGHWFGRGRGAHEVSAYTRSLEEGSELARSGGLLGRGLDLFGFKQLRTLFSHIKLGKLFEFQGFPQGPASLPEGLGRDAMIGLRGIPGVSQLIGTVARLGSTFGRLGSWMKPFVEVLGKIGSPLKWFTGGLERLGLRFIPLVGEILLAIDTVRFLGKHMKDIGFIAGEVGGWLAKNFPGIIRGAASLAMAAMHDLIGSLLSVINPRNWLHAGSDFIHGIGAGYQAATAPPAGAAHGPVTIHVHVAAGKNAHETGRIIGAQLAHHIAKAGDHANAAIGPGISGSAVPARH